MTEKELRALIADMTLEEKVGQMVQRNLETGTPAKKTEKKPIEGTISGMPERDPETGAVGGDFGTDDGIRHLDNPYLLGSFLGLCGTKTITPLREEYTAKQPHHIPPLFMLDVINGHRTVFPVPLALGATFSPDDVEESCRVAARESAVAGVQVTFSPMLDLARDPRWGRVMETPGEDPTLNSAMARAMVRGYQGDDLSKPDRIAACLKHFAAYSLPDGGRDYDNVELSTRTLKEDYLPAYAAAVSEGCRMAMTSFNTLDRVPSSGNRWLMRDILRGEMGFDGVTISDYGAIEEMVNHGFCEDAREAAKRAIEAGVDIDMMSNAYSDNLADLVRSGEVDEALVDEAVYRILKLKNDLGLFDRPAKDESPEREQNDRLTSADRALARRIAQKSFVLTKNDAMLPMGMQNTALIGPYADNREMFGSWSFLSDTNTVETIKEAFEKRAKIAYAKGSYWLGKGDRIRGENRLPYDEEENARLLEEAVKVARENEKIVLCLGEHPGQSGEATSRVSLKLPAIQLELLRRLHDVNPNIVTVVFCGRPVELREIEALSRAVLVVWMPGTEGAEAIANVLDGTVAPEGKLSITFPVEVGQVPIYYNRYATGRPNTHKDGSPDEYRNGYADSACLPYHPFGYGLTYTTFAYSPVTLDSNEMNKDGKINASVTVKNTGDRQATETVQLYIRDVAGSVSRPLRSLKGFKKVTLAPGEESTVSFAITEDMLRFWRIDYTYGSEPGKFIVYIGGDSDTENQATFRLI